MTAFSADTDVHVLDDPDAVAHAVAAWLVEAVKAMGDRAIAISLSGGQTPRLLYGALAEAPYCQNMPWPRIHLFWSDERFVPSTDERNNFNMARHLLASCVPMVCENIHPIPTTGMTPERAAQSYEEELKRFHGARELAPDRPLFDVTFLGVGDDGHTASLFPGSPVLSERERWVAAVAPDKREARITLTYPALESSRHVVFIVTGAAKRAIMQRISSRDEALPAVRLRPHGATHWFLDRAAAPGQAS